MFTVCPKCALTLVVTAADLRVAQGYVRCGRCSNVFNALARLSEDRQAAIAAAQAQQQPQQSTPPVPRPPSPSATASATSTLKKLPEQPSRRPETARPSQTSPPTRPVQTTPQQPPTPRPPQSQPKAPVQAPTSRVSQAQQPVQSAAPRQPPASTQTPTPRQPQIPVRVATPAPPAARSPDPKSTQRYGDDDVFPDDALEFNPNATDVTKVFIEQHPSPEFEAATGTFKALKLEAEDSARAEENRVRSDRHDITSLQGLEPVDTQVDVEIDPDVLAAMAQMSNIRLAKLELARAADPFAPESGAAFAPFDTPSREAASVPSHASPESPEIAAAPSAKATAPGRAPARARQSPPMEQPASPSPSMRLAERAKARARPVPAESVLATQGALGTRKRVVPIEEEAAAQPPSTSALLPVLWMTGSVLLALLLSAQVVHHYRNDLAANESLNGPLTSLYAALRVPLIPRWNLGAYEVRQLGASTGADAPGQITVRASVKNGAHQSQPLPLLRVTLQDRFGNRIAARDVPPQSYLPRAIPRTSLLSAGQRIDAEMAFVDPGSNAVGFEIDACLPAPGGGISCANDSAPR